MIPETAIEAAAEGIYDAAFGQELPEAPIDLATAALEAALPHLEAALRKQIANDIRDYADAADVDFIQVGNAHVRRNPYASGHYEEAARIAEEGTTK